MAWEKIFAEHISDKRLLSKTDKALLKVNHRNIKKINSVKRFEKVRLQKKKKNAQMSNTREDAQHHLLLGKC